MAMLLAARFEFTEQQYRYYTSDIKMAEKAGLNRGTWRRHRISLEKSGVMRSIYNNAYKGEFPVWTKWFENFNNGAFVQQHDERLRQYAANAQPKRVHLNLDAMKEEKSNAQINDSMKRIRNRKVANAQHPQKGPDTITDDINRESPKNRPIAALQQRSAVFKKCENCDGRVEGMQLAWSQLKDKKILCKQCCPPKAWMSG